MSTKTIVTEFESRHQFLDFLKSNPGHIVVKLAQIGVVHVKKSMTK